MADELTHESTPEDIKSFVDDIHAERTGEAAPEPSKEPKSDAAIVADVAAIETPTAAPKKGSETTAEAPSKAKSEKPSDRAWLDDDLKAEVSAYGLSEEAIADFTSREEVERAMRLFDNAALEAGRKAMAAGEEPKATRDEKGRFIPKGETETPVPAPEKPKGGYEVKLDKSVYDDAIVDEFTQLRDHYESRLEALEARLLQADAAAEEVRFDSTVDSLDMPKLFGKTGSESKEERQRRHDLLVQCKAHQVGLKQITGRDTDIESLVGRVARMVFADEFTKKELKSRTNRISRQSNGRMGGGATRPTDVPESNRDWADKLYRELVGS